ncbi:hypothetical protein Btru_065085 [Bulinus truncatus]|nr:hypothetical protein Btru_065085 [Bulinus truncatus]
MEMMWVFLVALVGTKVLGFPVEYVYEYNSQILTGLPVHSSIYSGYRMYAQAHVQVFTKSKVKAQLQNIRLYNIQQPITQMEAHENLLPGEFLKEIISSESKNITDSLMIPFGFEYKDGQVLRFLIDAKETELSVNAKRGFVSMFEINLNKRMLLDDSFPQPVSQFKPVTSSYKVLETSAAGMCATMYTTRPSPDSGSLLFVTKVRDYTQCLERPVYFQTKYDGFFPIGHTKDNPLTTGAVIKYTVKIDTDKLTILSAVAENKIAFSPFVKKGAVTTSVNQTLSLIEVKKISSEIPFTSNVKSSLIMSLPSKLSDPQDPFKEPSDESKKTPNPDVYHINTILTHLNHAADNTLNITSKESLVYLGVVVEMLSTSSKAVIKKLWNKLTHDYNEVDLKVELARQILFNVLPYVGTEAAANHVLDVCSGDKPMKFCDAAFNILALKATPTESLINKFINFIEQNKEQTSSKVRQTAYLTLGSLGYRLSRAKNIQLKELLKMEQMLQILQKDSNENTKDIIYEKKKNFDKKRATINSEFYKRGQAIVDKINELINKDTNADKVLGLKSLGNSGLPHAVPILRKILSDPNQPQYLRILAVQGHRRLYFERAIRIEALNTVLSVYSNTRETHEVRNWAFITLMQLHPELSTIETIAQGLHYEKDAHVSSLVLSYLESHANTTFYPFTTFVKNCSDALKFAPRSKNNYQHSFTNLITKMYDGTKIGKVLSLTSIGSMNSFQSWTISLDTYIFGLYSNLLELGINSMEISQLVNWLFGTNGLLTTNKSLFDILKQHKRATNPQEMIQEIFRLLKITPRNSGSPAAHIYLKLMGHELRYYDVTEYIRSIISQGKMDVLTEKSRVFTRLPIELSSMLYLMNTKLTLPTEAGFPVSLKLKVSKTLNLNGTFSAKIEQNLFEEDRIYWQPRSISASLDVKPKGVMECHGSMGLDGYFFKRVTSFQALLEFSMPIKKDFSFDFTSKKFKLVGHVPELDKPLVKFMMQPYAESVTLTNSGDLSSVQVDTLPLCSHNVVPINTFYDLQSFGYKVGLVGQLPYPFTWHHPLHIMGGKTQISMWKKPMQDSPRLVTLTGQLVYPKVTNSSFSINASNENINKRNNSAKQGQSLPSSDISYIDPLDLDSTTITMHQLINKFEEVTGRSIPLHHEPEARGFILSLDASTENTQRKMQMEALWSKFVNGLLSTSLLRVWKSPMPDYSSREWQMVADFGLTYPVKIHEPKDIFSKIWQQEVLTELQYLVSKNSHQASNYLLHSMLKSEINMLNYPAMFRTPTYRILDNLVPEQMHKYMNNDGVSKNEWQMYWVKLSFVQDRVTEEKKRVVDPYNEKRDANIMCFLESIQKIQILLVSDLDEIIGGRSILHSELPIVQWIIFNHVTVLNNLNKIIQGHIAKDSFTPVQNITNLMKLAKQHQDNITKKFKQVLVNVLSNIARNVFPSSLQQSNSDADLMDQSLLHLSILQMEVLS